MPYDSKTTQDNLEYVLDIATYQNVDAEKELTEILNDELTKTTHSLKTVLERLSKISAYMQELTEQEEKLLSELTGDMVKDQAPSLKRDKPKGLLQNLVTLCDILDKKMSEYQKNIESLKNIIG
jgi:septal ring factor EnvC (AmiA/AmiB activator)